MWLEIEPRPEEVTEMPTLIRIEAVEAQPGYRPGLRLVLDYDGAPASTIKAYHPQPDARLFPCFSWSPETGHYCMSQDHRDGSVAIPAEPVWRLAGFEGHVIPKPVEVKVLVRDGKRNLRPGQSVTCQPKQRKGTGKVEGIIKAVYDNETVAVATGVAVVTVDAEWVQARNGGK